MDDELKDEIKYRLRSPFYSSLLVGFVIWNWKAILVILYPMTEMELTERFDWIGQHVYGGELPTVIRVVLLPLVTAVVAVGVVPWFVNILDLMGYKAIVARRNRRMESDGKLRPTQQAMQTIRDENTAIRDILRKQEAELSAARTQIQDLRQHSDMLMLGYIAGASGLLAMDRATMGVLRDFSEPSQGLAHDSPSTHVLMRIRAIEQSTGSQQFTITEMGKALREYILKHIPLGRPHTGQ